MVQEWIGSQNATIVELVQEWIGSGMDWFTERDDSRIGSGMGIADSQRRQQLAAARSGNTLT